MKSRIVSLLVLLALSALASKFLPGPPMAAPDQTPAAKVMPADASPSKVVPIKGSPCRCLAERTKPGKLTLSLDYLPPHTSSGGCVRTSRGGPRQVRAGGEKMDAYFTAVWSNSGSGPVTIDDLGVDAGGRMSIYRHVTQSGVVYDELVTTLEAAPQHLGNPAVTIKPGGKCGWMTFHWPGARQATTGEYVARLEKPHKAQSGFVVAP